MTHGAGWDFGRVCCLWFFHCGACTFSGQCHAGVGSFSERKECLCRDPILRTLMLLKRLHIIWRFPSFKAATALPDGNPPPCSSRGGSGQACLSKEEMGGRGGAAPKEKLGIAPEGLWAGRAGMVGCCLLCQQGSNSSCAFLKNLLPLEGGNWDLDAKSRGFLRVLFMQV